MVHKTNIIKKVVANHDKTFMNVILVSICWNNSAYERSQHIKIDKACKKMYLISETNTEQYT